MEGKRLNEAVEFFFIFTEGFTPQQKQFTSSREAIVIYLFLGILPEGDKCEEENKKTKETVVSPKVLQQFFFFFQIPPPPGHISVEPTATDNVTVQWARIKRRNKWQNLRSSE